MGNHPSAMAAAVISGMPAFERRSSNLGLNPVLERVASRDHNTLDPQCALVRSNSRDLSGLASLSRQGSRGDLGATIPISLSGAGSMHARDGVLLKSSDSDGIPDLSRVGSQDLLSLVGVEGLLDDVSVEDLNVLSRVSSRDCNNMLEDMLKANPRELVVPLTAGLEQGTNPNNKMLRTRSNELGERACTLGGGSLSVLDRCSEESPLDNLVVQGPNGGEIPLGNNSFGEIEIPAALNFDLLNQPQPSVPLQPLKRSRCHSFDNHTNHTSNAFASLPSVQLQISHSAPSFGSAVPNFSNPQHPPVAMPIDSPRAEAREPDEWEGKHIVMKKGKYAGRPAFVKERVNKKYRVEIEGVSMKLEFYSTSFQHV